MMLVRRVPSLFKCTAAGALVLVLAGCTKGGQFDPTTLFDSDMFASKKALQGQREPVFPDGVPGTTTGVPPDLVKGYQAPPDQTAADAAAAATAPAQQPAEKPKPKPRLASAPAQNAPTSAAHQKPVQTPPTRISVGPAPKPAAQGTASSQSGGTASPQAAPAQQNAAPGASSQSVWPAPPQTAPQQSSQSVWPNPPSPGTTSQ